MKSEQTEPKDLGAKIAANPEHAFWIDLKAKLESDNLAHKRQIEINANILVFANSKISKYKS